MRSTAILVAILFVPGFAAAQADPPTPALPGSIPIFPLQDVTLFPNSIQPFHIFEPRYRDMVADALAGDSIIGMATLRPGFEADYEGRPPVYELGSAGVIVASEELEDGRYNIVLRAFTKFRILSEEEGRAYRIAAVEEVPEAGAGPAELAEQRRELEDAVLSVFPGARPPPADVPDEQAIDGISLAIPMRPEERMGLLSMDGPMERARALVRRLRRGPPSAL
jgi:Lon protease-like protein